MCIRDSLDTTGLLVFSTDGDLGQRLLHPSRHVWKTYWALCDGHVRDRELEELRRGIVLDDGPVSYTHLDVYKRQRELSDLR